MESEQHFVPDYEEEGDLTMPVTPDTEASASDDSMVEITGVFILVDETGSEGELPETCVIDGLMGASGELLGLQEVASTGASGQHTQATAGILNTSLGGGTDSEEFQILDEVVNESRMSKKVRRQECALCHVRARKLKEHFRRNHIPWYFSPLSACWSCCVQEGATTFLAKHTNCKIPTYPKRLWSYLMNGILLLWCKWVGVQHPGQLLHYVLVHELHPKAISGANVPDFSEDEIGLLQAYNLVNGLQEPDFYRIRPPTSVACLLHWRIASCILSNISTPKQEQFQGYFHPTTYSGIDVHTQVEWFSAADSHFHLDRILERKAYSSIPELQFSCAKDCYLDLSIANFVYPATWDQWILTKDQPGFYCTFGVHPRNVSDEFSASKLWELLNLSNCVGVGEVGLEYNIKCKCQPRCTNVRKCCALQVVRQQAFFRDAAVAAYALNKVLVIHCRDSGPTTGTINDRAARVVLCTLEQLQLTTHKIHRHCFLGDAEQLCHWASKLPNCYFGITSRFVERSQTNPELTQALREITLDRILLESDSPHMNPKQPHGTLDGCNVPWTIVYQATHLASIFQTTVGRVLARTLGNCRRLYGIPD
jgi:TatD DNase family protein